MSLFPEPVTYDCSGKLTGSEKINITYMYIRKSSFEHEDSNGNKKYLEDKVLDMASNLDGGIFTHRERYM